MPTCRKCINWSKCVNNDNQTRYYGKDIAADNVDELCKWFTDNKEFIEVPKTGIGDLSDGYHTFNELYHHRAVLFSVICNMFPERAWKSKKHDTGDMFEGMFIVGIETDEGQATYHYDIDPYWDMFEVNELDFAPKWDGHTPEEAIKRISTLHMTGSKPAGAWLYYSTTMMECSVCGRHTARHRFEFCPHCGSAMIPKIQVKETECETYEQLTLFDSIAGGSTSE